MESVNFSHAQVVASASFSIWVYQRSDQDVNPTGFQESNLWSSTAPRPCADVSAEIFVGAEGSYSASVVGRESSSFTWLNAAVRGGPHVHNCALLISSHSGWVILARSRVNVLS